MPQQPNQISKPVDAIVPVRIPKPIKLLGFDVISSLLVPEGQVWMVTDKHKLIMNIHAQGEK